MLLIVVPFLLALVGGAIWLHGGRTVGTEDAYVKADIAQIAPEVSGRVVEVLVRDHAAVSGRRRRWSSSIPSRSAWRSTRPRPSSTTRAPTVETARAQWLETHQRTGRSRERRPTT